MLRPLPWSHRSLSETNSIVVAISRMSAAPKSPSHPPHLLGRPVRPQPQHPEQQRHHRPEVHLRELDRVAGQREYVIVHEMAHLIEPTHSDRFIAILEEHYPSWREARAELNELPLAAAVWKE